jgi:hypothetical protein
MGEKKLKDQTVLLHVVPEAVRQGPALFATDERYQILSNVLVEDEETWIIMSHLINLIVNYIFKCIQKFNSGNGVGYIKCMQHRMSLFHQ